MKKLTLITAVLIITVQSYGQWYPIDINTDALLGKLLAILTASQALLLLLLALAAPHPPYCFYPHL